MTAADLGSGAVAEASRALGAQPRGSSASSLATPPRVSEPSELATRTAAVPGPGPVDAVLREFHLGSPSVTLAAAVLYRLAVSVYLVQKRWFFIFVRAFLLVWA